jgi:uncharacterized membrane-anchored protein
MDFNTAFLWVLNSGGAAIVASFILERVAAYQEQTADAKYNIFIGVSVVISLIAYSVLTYVPAEVLAQIAPFFAVIYGAVVAAVSGTAFHKLTKSNAQG